jgi:hypothetical protein
MFSLFIYGRGIRILHLLKTLKYFQYRMESLLILKLFKIREVIAENIFRPVQHKLMLLYCIIEK